MIIFLCTLLLTIVISSKTRVSEKEYSEAANIHPRLRTRLNNFRRQKETMKKEAERSGEEIVPIRPEWTTVDRILASRYAVIIIY